MKKFIEKHADILIYVVFGVLTTIVDFLVYWPLYNILGMSIVLSNTIAWIAAVLFAFLTNKPFVFKSNDWSRRVVFSEFMKFISCRISSWLVQTIILYVTVHWLLLNGNWMKLLSMVLVIILNYLGSKLFVFHSKE